MNGKLLIPIVLAVILASTSLIPLLTFFNPQPANQEVKQGLNYKGIMCAYYRHAGGEWKLLGCQHNLLTDIGKEKIEDQLVSPEAASTGNQLKYIAVTNDSSQCASSSATNINEITTSDLERAECTYTDLGSGKWSCENTFHATQSHPGVKIAGYFWDETPGQDNTMFACANFTSVNLESGDSILIRWNISIS